MQLEASKELLTHAEGASARIRRTIDVTTGRAHFPSLHQGQHVRAALLPREAQGGTASEGVGHAEIGRVVEQGAHRLGVRRAAVPFPVDVPGAAHGVDQRVGRGPRPRLQEPPHGPGRPVSRSHGEGLGQRRGIGVGAGEEPSHRVVLPLVHGMHQRRPIVHARALRGVRPCIEQCFHEVDPAQTGGPGQGGRLPAGDGRLGWHRRRGVAAPPEACRPRRPCRDPRTG
jgi:hypothetical protein